MSNTESTRSTTVRLPASLHAEIQDAAADDDRSFTYMLVKFARIGLGEWRRERIDNAREAAQ